MRDVTYRLKLEIAYKDVGSCNLVRRCITIYPGEAEHERDNSCWFFLYKTLPYGHKEVAPTFWFLPQPYDSKCTSSIYVGLQ